MDWLTCTHIPEKGMVNHLRNLLLKLLPKEISAGIKGVQAFPIQLENYGGLLYFKLIDVNFHSDINHTYPGNFWQNGGPFHPRKYVPSCCFFSLTPYSQPCLSTVCLNLYHLR